MSYDSNATITGRNHPETSYIAAEKTLGHSGTARRKVLAEIVEGWPGLTDEEVQERLRMPPNTERPRRVELVRMGFVKDSGVRRPTVWGNPSIVWSATPKGTAVLQFAAARGNA
jgi:hypothetical protein